MGIVNFPVGADTRPVVDSTGGCRHPSAKNIFLHACKPEFIQGSKS
jgi:hypothetical protein